MELVEFLFVRPSFMMSQAPANKTRLYMPTWIPEPCPIRAIEFWNESGMVPAGANAYWGFSHDHASAYCSEANYPTQERTTPRVTTTLGSMILRPENDPSMTVHMPGNDAVMYSRGAGDCFIFVAANRTPVIDFPVFPFIGVKWLQDGPIVEPFAKGTRLAIEGTYFTAYGQNLVRDESLANHQLAIKGNAYVRHDGYGPPGKTSCIEFNGAGWIEINDCLVDFDWPGDFSLSAIVRTTNATLENGSGRHIFSGGPNLATSAAFAITTGGSLAFGNELTGFIAIGTSNIADGNWHTVEARRTAGTLMLFVDSVQQASVSDATHYLATDMALIGRFSAGGVARGHWFGHMASVRAVRPF